MTDKGLDLGAGVALDAIEEGKLQQAYVGDTDVVVIRQGDAVHVLDATCTHLGAPLAEGLLVGNRLRCPWHIACFDIRTGVAVEAPAFDPLRCWKVSVADGVVRTIAPDEEPLSAPGAAKGQKPYVIVGGGAAAYAAARTLRAEGYAGPVTMFSLEADTPYDRTLLTKDYLAGTVGDDNLPIAHMSLADLGVTFQAKTRVSGIDPKAGQVFLEGGEALDFAKLLLATGAEPKTPDIPGIDLSQVTLLRSVTDCRRILSEAEPAHHAVVLGGSFIATEAAASLRERGLAVTLVAPEAKPLARIFGDEIADQICLVHVKNGVKLLAGRKVARIEKGQVTLDDGKHITCDLVVIGAGVAPAVELAAKAGLQTDNGVVVDDMLRTSHPDIFAAGDIAAWPDPHSGKRIRVEHWVVAERQGQVAARNMLGAEIRFQDVPFFWTKQFDFSLTYLGHSEDWDQVEVDGSVANSDATVRYIKAGRVQAAAFVGRKLDCLRQREAMMASLEPAAQRA